MKKALSAAALIAALTLTGCSQTGATSSQAEPAAESAAAETTEAAPETTEAAPETTEAEPTPEATVENTFEPNPGNSEKAFGVQATEGAVKFGETWTYEDGVQITVTPVGPSLATEYAAGGEATGGEIFIFDVVVLNGSDAIFDPTMFMESMQYGAAGMQAERVFDSGNPAVGDSGSFEGKILPQKQQTARMAYAIPAAELGDVTMIVSPSYDHIDAIYTGPLV